MKRPEKILFASYALVLLVGCCVDFFDIAWGTGIWLGEFALTWALLLVFFCICCLVLFILMVRVLRRDDDLKVLLAKLIVYRNNLKWPRWLLLVMLLVLPIWFLQFTVFGVVFRGLYLRVSLWTLQLFFLSFFATTKRDRLIDWNVFLYSIVLTAASFSVFASLRSVTDYPFSLGWSEGNRLWDYSILFGRERYDYPAGQKINVLLDIGRQIVGGLPFLIPGLTIGMERMWVGLISILPYILLGAIAFRSFIGDKYLWLGAVLWSYLFLNQGPIHPPLVLCAVLIALAWRNRLWLSGLLVVCATYAAYVSRYTWTFAPGIWFVLLEFLDTPASGSNGTRVSARMRTLLKILAWGMLAAAVVVLGALFYSGSSGVSEISAFFSNLEISPQNLREKISQQSLLWYRLLPNETYGSGILVGLTFAALPLILVLIYLLRSRKWMINIWQKWLTALSLFAFLVVGLVVSTKIGGGGDLHNLDMFLIGLYFVGAIAFHNGGWDWLQNSQLQPLSIKTLLILFLALPGIGPLQEMRPYDFSSAAPWLVALTDSPNERSLGMYPSENAIEKSLSTIQRAVDLAKADGEVLFMDQRQLLTFGFIQNAPLVPDYDKKALMEKALTKDRDYFQEFYRDLEENRFSLVIVQPLNTPRKGSEFQFGEENNAWVKWVANPLLCFYEIKQTLTDVNVQLLIPRSTVADCAEVLP